jgi:N6-adenosine-specific RNA methylase IME4
VSNHLVASLAAIRPHGGAGAVLADPNYKYVTWSSKGEGRSASRHYRTSSLDEIKALPVADVAAADCWLFLWLPNPFAPCVEELMQAWGFRFSGSAFCWVKLNRSGSGYAFGQGHTTRKNVEMCWLGRRGSPRRNAKNVRELIVAPRREHSRKPDEQYERIQRFCDGPYVELFARQQWPGWIAWGDEIDRFEPPYDCADDINKSVLEGFRAIRERKAAGGRGWGES